MAVPDCLHSIIKGGHNFDLYCCHSVIYYPVAMKATFIKHKPSDVVFIAENNYI